MSPISSEKLARVAEHSRRLRDARAERRFRTRFWMLIAVLGAISAVFLVLGAFQGPKLSSAQVDAARATEQSGQQLRFFANQPVDDVAAAQVTVEPAAEVAVTVQNELVTVQFLTRLRWNTDYTVRIDGVTSPGRSVPGSMEHRFTTPEGELLYLDRGEELDEVLRAPVVGGGRGEVLYSAPGIQRYALVEGALLVARDTSAATGPEGEQSPEANVAGVSVLEVVDLASGRSEEIRLPSPVRVESITAEPAGTTVALVLTSVGGQDASEPFQQSLVTLDLGGAREVQPVQGLDGEGLRVRGAWYPGSGTALLAHTIDGVLLQIDQVSGTPPLPLGDYREVFGPSSDGGRLAATDDFGGVLLDLASGEEGRVNPSLFEGEIVFAGETRVTAADLRVQKVAVAAEDGTFTTLLVADDGGGASRLLARTIDDRGSLGDLALAPNDQYVAVEVTPVLSEAVSDGRKVAPRPTSITIAVIDLDSGAVVRTLAGFAPSW